MLAEPSVLPGAGRVAIDGVDRQLEQFTRSRNHAADHPSAAFTIGGLGGQFVLDPRDLGLNPLRGLDQIAQIVWISGAVHHVLISRMAAPNRS